MQLTEILPRLHSIFNDSSLQAQPVVQGLSDSHVWKVRSGESAYCLKLHPASSRLPLSEIHFYQKLLAVRFPIIPRPCTFDTSGTTFLETSSGKWELMPWLPGQAKETIDSFSRHDIQQVMQGIADVQTYLAEQQSQRLSKSLGNSNQMVPKGWLDRHRELQIPLKLPNVPANAAREFQWHYTNLARIETANLQRVSQHLSSMIQANRTCIWSLRDLWRANVIFDGEKLTGFIDFSAARLDWPGFPILRFLASAIDFRRESWCDALKRYNELLKQQCHNQDYSRYAYLSIDEGEAATTIFASLVIAGRYWLRKWSQGGDSNRIAIRLTEILSQLEHLNAFQKSD